MGMRSSLGRVRGLGSAKEGVGHWWAQRLTAVALVPLALWFVFSLAGLAGAGYEAFAAWLGNHGNALLMILFVGTLFHHAQLGLQVVIEDYVHDEATKLVSLVVVKFAAVALAASSVLAVLRVSFGG
jgi:succinate dehydrogenase / fumarate reductase membrane anchor subunit